MILKRHETSEDGWSTDYSLVAILVVAVFVPLHRSVLSPSAILAVACTP